MGCGASKKGAVQEVTVPTKGGKPSSVDASKAPEPAPIPAAKETPADKPPVKPAKPEAGKPAEGTPVKPTTSTAPPATSGLKKTGGVTQGLDDTITTLHRSHSENIFREEKPTAVDWLPEYEP